MLCTPDASFLGVYCGDVFQSKMGNVPASENRRYKHVRLNVLMTRNLLARQRIACTGDCEVDFHRRYGFSGVFSLFVYRKRRKEREMYRMDRTFLESAQMRARVCAHKEVSGNTRYKRYIQRICW